MQRESPQGRLVGTFEGRYGDQFSLAESMSDVFVSSAGVDPDTGESLVEIEIIADKPVDEHRTSVTLPLYAWERMKDIVEEDL